MKEGDLIRLMFNTEDELLLETFKNEFGYDAFYADMYWFLRGTLPITLLAHVDTVGSRKDLKKPVIQYRRLITRSNGILGGDDRAGCMAIWKILKSRIHHNEALPNILLCNYEESGAKGVRDFVSKGIYNFADTNLCIEIDRKGCNDYVTYSKELEAPVKDYIESFGFDSQWGTFSDISVIIDKHSVSSINVSAGYYNNHTKDEYVKLDELDLTISRVQAILNDPIKERHLMKDKWVSNWDRNTKTTYYNDNWTYKYKRNKHGKYEMDKVWKTKYTPPTQTATAPIFADRYPYNPINGKYECKKCHKVWKDCNCYRVNTTPAKVISIADAKNDIAMDSGYFQDSDGKWVCCYCDREMKDCDCQWRGSAWYGCY